MKKLFFALLLAALVPTVANAQRLIGKELKSEDPSVYYDDRVYQWVMYTYVLGTDTLDAAFDINGKRITPNGYRYEYAKGVNYKGGGVFEVRSKKKDKFGRSIYSGYTIDGKSIFPQTLMELLGCVGIFHIGNGLFELQTFVAEKKSVLSLYNKKGECLIPKEMGFNDYFIFGEADLKYVYCQMGDYGNGTCAAYDLNGKVVIPKSCGYTYIYYSEGFWHCKDASKNNSTYSKDLRYVAEGYFYKEKANEFNEKKRSNPNYNGPYNFGPGYSESNSDDRYTPNPPSPNPPTPDPPKPNTPKPDPVPVQVWKACGMCSGGGVCYMCNGAGGYYFGVNAKWMECTACHGLKRCTFCAGQGGHYEVEYR